MAEPDGVQGGREWEGTEEEGEARGGDDTDDADEVPVSLEKEQPPEEARVLTLELAKSGLSLLGRTASGLQHAYLMMTLTDLGLVDVSVLPTFRHLLFVDVSGNQLTDTTVQVLSKMAHLLSIKADRNRLTEPRLPPMSYLQVLTLNENAITSVQGIAHPLLECLELNHNQVSSVGDLDPADVPRLRVLELRGNRLESLDGLRLESLESLYVAGNSLTTLRGLEGLVNLRVLHARGNPVESLDGLGDSLKALRYLNVRDCKVGSARETRKLAVLPGLKVLVVSGNPFTRGLDEEDQLEDYRGQVLAFLPRLRRLDKLEVGELERSDAEELRQQLLEQDEATGHSQQL